MTEFDKFAPDYEALHRQSIAFSGCEPAYFAQYKVEYAASRFRQYYRSGDKLFDFGCGTGASIPYFGKYLAEAKLVCADVSSQSLEIARHRFGDEASYLLIEGDSLGVESNSIGMSFSSCVFHHIPPEQHSLWIAELYRVTRPGGVLLIFEHNPINPLTRYAVASCAFDKDAILLRASILIDRLTAGGWAVRRTRYHVFFPGFLKKLRPAEAMLGWLPLGGQYSVLALKK